MSVPLEPTLTALTEGQSRDQESWNKHAKIQVGFNSLTGCSSFWLMRIQILTWMINFWSQDRQSGSMQHKINSLLVLLLIIYHDKCARYTSERPSTEAWGPVAFTELNILIFFLICRQKGHIWTQDLPYSQHLHHSPNYHPGEEESHKTPWSCHGSTKEKKNEATTTNWPT